MINVEIAVVPHWSLVVSGSQDAIFDVLSEAGDKLRERIQEEPGPVVYPIAWKSEAQRSTVLRKLHATGIPYVRRHHVLSEDLYRSWRIRRQRHPRVVITIYTNVSYAPYVKTQAGIQPFHRRTGHKTVEEDIRAVGIGRVVDTVITQRLATV